ncbi:hypothetical protein D9M71_495000 [compost metagenome]
MTQELKPFASIVQLAAEGEGQVEVMGVEEVERQRDLDQVQRTFQVLRLNPGIEFIVELTGLFVCQGRQADLLSQYNSMAIADFRISLFDAFDQPVPQPHRVDQVDCPQHALQREHVVVAAPVVFIHLAHVDALFVRIDHVLKGGQRSNPVIGVGVSFREYAEEHAVILYHPRGFDVGRKQVRHMFDDVRTDQVIEGFVGERNVGEVAQCVDPGGLGLVVGLFVCVELEVFQIERIQKRLAVTRPHIEAVRQVESIMAAGTDFQAGTLTILVGQRHTVHVHIDSYSL